MALKNYEWFASRLEPARIESEAPGARSGFYACPVHGGSDSLHVTEKNGKALVTCFAESCGYAEIVAALEDVEPEAENVISIRRRSAPAARPAYAPTGEHVADQVGGRWSPPLRPRGISPDQLHGGLATVADVPPGEPIVFAEGHGPAIALNAAGIPAVCSVTGKAGGISEVGASFLYGRTVILCPDVGGEEHMERCGAVLARVAGRVLAAPAWPDDMEANEDAADFIDRYGVEAMRRHLAGAEPWEPAEDDDFLVGWADSLDLSEAAPLLLGYLDPDDYSVLFGDGGTGKGVVAAWWASQLTRDGWVVVLLDYEQNTRLEWVPRVTRFGGDLSRLLVVQPTGAIWDHAERVRDVVARAEDAHPGSPVYLVVDSIGYAIGDAKLEDSSTATRYKKALNVIGRPALSLAHTTKANADPRHPFGSVFWSNNVRHTMSVSRKSDADDAPRMLRNKKANRRGEFEAVEIDWSWVRDELPATLTFSRSTTSTSSRIVEALAAGPMTVKEVVAALASDGAGDEVSDRTVAAALNRGDAFVSDGKKPARWSLATPTIRRAAGV